MTHIFKVTFQGADLFVYGIADGEIDYEVRRGAPLSEVIKARGKSKYESHDGMIVFDGIGIVADLFVQIEQTLKDTEAESDPRRPAMPNDAIPPKL